MNKILAALGAAGLIAGALILTTPEDYKSCAEECPKEKIKKDSTQRIALIENKSNPGEFCACAVWDKGKIEDELEEKDSTDPDKQQKLLVCDVAGKLKTVYILQTEDVPAGCIVAAEKFLFRDSMKGYNSRLVKELQASCAPCIVGASAWGECPYCLHPSYGKTCDQACPVETDGP